MATQNLNSPQASRQAFFNGEMLSHVVPQEVIGKCCRGMKKSLPRNQTDTIKFRRYLPKGATVNTPNTWNVQPASHLLSEGETPIAETLIAQDITAQLQQYGLLYRYSDKQYDMHQDDIPSEMVKQTGERMGLLIEMIRYGVLRAGTNIFRAGLVASRNLIVGRVSGITLRSIARTLQSNLSKKVSSILPASAGVETHPVEAAYVVVHHSNVSADIRSQLTLGEGFIHVSAYAQRQVIHENELGSWEEFRFVASPHLDPYLLAGGTTAGANTVLANGVPNSAGTEAADVYPLLVLTEEAYGDVMLRGMNAIQAYHRKPGGGEGMNSSPDDPLGQRGHVGAKTYFTAVRLNELQMAVYEVAVGALVSAA